MSHEDYKEMIPAHALSALDWADDRAITDHLTQCVECRDELNEWQQTAAVMALSASPAEPSPLVRQQILSQIRSERDESITAKVVPFKAPQKISGVHLDRWELSPPLLSSRCWWVICSSFGERTAH